MSKDGKDSLAARYESWKQLGCASVVDCAVHHRRFGFTKWNQSHPHNQLVGNSRGRIELLLLQAYPESQNLNRQ
jgi:hypothetical protein